jgi:predicted acyltransferase (DUF342 family)
MTTARENVKKLSEKTRSLFNKASASYGPFYGLYRGKVINNIDPMELNRLLVDVPTLPCSIASFAYPQAAYGGIQVGMVLTPPMGANVWVKFENGDPSYPIWVGCFWTEGQKPVMAELPTQQLLSTGSLNAMVNDIPGEAEFLVELGPPGVEVPVTISLNTEAVTMTVGDVVFTATPEEVSALMEPTNAMFTNEAIMMEASGEINMTSPEIAVTGNTSIVGAVEVTGNVEQTGAVEIEGNVEQVGAVEIEGNVEVAGAVELEGNLNVVGAVEIEGNLNIAGAATIEGDVALLGACEIAGDMAIAGAIEVAGDIALAGAMEIAGAMVSVAYSQGGLNTI